MDFCHLHVHSHYSILDSVVRIGELVDRVRELGMRGCALTDHGAMFGALEFFLECRKTEKKGKKITPIKPIIGCELYISEATVKQGACRKLYHLVILAKDMDGYRNLLKIVSHPHINSEVVDIPVVTREVLSRYSNGLIALSGCLAGEIPQKILRKEVEGVEKIAGEYMDIFGRENFFLELDATEVGEQETVNLELIALSKRLGLGLVAANDVHYLRRDDAILNQILLCIQMGRMLQGDDRKKARLDGFYLKSPQEMQEYFNGVPEALSNTVKIMEMCDVRIDTEEDEIHFPEFIPPDGKTPDAYLGELAREGLEIRFEEFAGKGLHFDREEYVARLEYELKVIGNLRFASYFLIVRDFIKFARDNGIPVGFGRGSAAGSLVSYVLGITDIDPIKYGLLFERFLNPERRSLPDIDIDLCEVGREKVVNYVKEKYGRDKAAQIITFGILKAKSVIKDVGRVLGYQFSETNRITDLIPEKPEEGKKDVLLSDLILENQKLKELVASREDYRELFNYAARLQGLARQTSVHPAGIVIADRPLIEYVPLYRGANGVLVPQYDMEEIGSLGLIKFDLLGLTALTRMKAAEDLIRERHNKNFRYTDIPLDDPKTFELMSQGHTAGIFQFESRGMRELLQKMKPDRIEDLIAANALFRPGPLGMKTNDVYIRRKHGIDPVRYKHPLLEEILKETYGTIVYQEQVMKIATTMGGFTMGEADTLRHAMGKKKQDKIRSMRDKFTEGAVKKGIPEAIAAEIYDEMVPFGEYGFNKSHSAAYAIFAYMTAYIKVHYPVEFFVTLLNSEVGDNDKISRFIREARSSGIKILPPDVNSSMVLFEITGEKEIRYALSAIKNIGGAADMIVGARREGSFISFGDFLERVDLSRVNRRVIESLIKCGAFDSMGYSRASLMNSIDRGFEYAAMRQREKASGQLGIFDSDKSQGVTGLKAADFVPREREWDEKIKLTFEKEVMGFFFSGHPLDHYMQETERLGVSLIQDLDLADGERVSVFGMVVSRQEKTSKEGMKYAKLTIEDPTGSLEVMVFRNAYQKWEKVRDSNEPLIFSGILKVREDQEKVYKSLYADDFTLLSAASRNMISEVKIYIDADASGVDKLKALKDVIIRHSGDKRVFLHLRDREAGEVVLRTGAKFRVNPTKDFIEEVEKIAGSEKVVIV